MGCTPAKTCRNALTEATFFWPKRNRASDGICGDEAHQRRKSDHNDGNAFDLTHDPFNGLDTYAIARMLAEAVLEGKEPRVKYIISHGQIFSQRNGKWAWRKYTGPNKHDHHMHVSINANARNSAASWWARFMPKEIPEMTPEEKKMLLKANHIVEVEFPKLKTKVLNQQKEIDRLKAKAG